MTTWETPEILELDPVGFVCVRVTARMRRCMGKLYDLPSTRQPHCTIALQRTSSPLILPSTHQELGGDGEMLRDDVEHPSS